MIRRSFLKSCALTLGASVVSVPAFCQTRNPSEKLNVAHVGVGGMVGDFHLQGSATENKLGLCDIDDDILNKASAAWPTAKRYADWRVMLDELGDQLDGVIITAPDHVHACAATAFMDRGIHCYCEKPLAHDIWQIRQMQKKAKEKNLITQMGTQVHASSNYRRAVELVQSGAIGKVSDVQVWCGVVWGGQPATKLNVLPPKSVHWDLWIGPAPMRSYQPCYLSGNRDAYRRLECDIDVPKTCYLSGNWRCWWDFGAGGIGDMGCHLIDLPFWALGLTYPKTIESSSPQAVDADHCPKDLVCKYTFTQSDGSPLTLTWSDGDLRPEILKKWGIPEKSYGILFVGAEGALYVNYAEHFLLPRDKFADFKTPEATIPDSPGHHAEWFNAIRSGKRTTCDFDYSGKVSETILLGTFAYRAGKKLEYDAETMTAANCPEADRYFKQPYRNGWGLK